ncbi:MAG: hypothetical protein PHV74_04765 [Dehalococcoidia bacterium]|nr:hypothetical protein [Dehalococcoidia bacterium]
MLSVIARGPGGQISTVIVNLHGTTGAQYYESSSNTIRDAGMDTPMRRVYVIEGEEAYLVTVGSRYEYNDYRKALTHEMVRGTAVATDKWQVELPNAGNIPADSPLIVVVAANVFNQQSTTTISLKLVEDVTAPEMEAKARCSTGSRPARVGDSVTIEVRGVDDLSGVFSVRLEGEGAEAVFGENANVRLSREPNVDVWSIQNTVARNVAPGVYPVEVVAVDRAGNETIQTVEVKVTKEVTSFQICLHEGWNLISVPRALKNPQVGAVFAGLPVEEVRTMIAGRWTDVSEITPGLGYMVKAVADVNLEADFEEHDVSTTPQTINLGQGWSLIGYTSQALVPQMPLSFYLGDDLKGKWLTVYTEEGDQSRPQSTSPYIWATDGFPSITGEPYSANRSDNLPAVELGKGYWIYLIDAGVLVP